MFQISHALVAALLTAVMISAAALAQSPTPDDDGTGALSFKTVFAGGQVSAAAARALAERGKTDAIAVLALAARYQRGNQAIFEALSALSGKTIADWRSAMLWQQRHREVIPHESYRELKLEVLSRIDHNFLRFLGGDLSRRENLKIRLEEITWGGVPVDGIPSLDDPPLIAAGEADYLNGDDLVFGVDINGDQRAYPLRIMGWHEMFNETIGGVPVALAYCTLCGSGILFETKVPGREEPLIFGSSGLLYRSNKLMFDRATDSLWNQFTGKPVSGPLRDAGIKLKIRPVVITSWRNWSRDHPETKVLSLQTGHRRDYRSGVVYAEYFASPDLMFPAVVRDETRLKRKDYVFGVRDIGTSKAWPLDLFDERKVINDDIAGRNIVLIGNAKTRTVRAYDRGENVFEVSPSDAELAAAHGIWTITESALVGPDGTRLPRRPGHIAYWFAWDGYLGIEGELAAPVTGADGR